MKIEIIFEESKCRVLKMIDEHCWEIIRDLLDDINKSSSNKNTKSISDIEDTLEMIRGVQKFKQRITDEIKNKITLSEILDLCKDDLIKESEEDILTAFFGYEIKIEK